MLVVVVEVRTNFKTENSGVCNDVTTHSQSTAVLVPVLIADTSNTAVVNVSRSCLCTNMRMICLLAE